MIRRIPFGLQDNEGKFMKKSEKESYNAPSPPLPCLLFHLYYNMVSVFLSGSSVNNAPRTYIRKVWLLRRSMLRSDAEIIQIEL